AKIDLLLSEIMRTHLAFRNTLLAVLTMPLGAVPGFCLQQSAEVSDSGMPSKPSCAGESCSSASPAQADARSAASMDDSEQKKPADASMTFKKVFVNLPGDQKAIWTSPFRLRWKDSLWAVPLAGGTGVLIGSDRHSMERARSNPTAISHSNTISDAGVAGLTALPAAMWVYGSWAGHPRQRETGLLSGEALINSLAVSEVLKVAFARQRPLPVGGQGKFFTEVSDASFPSMHSMLAWTSASVIAHEYPGPLTQAL